MNLNSNQPKTDPWNWPMPCKKDTMYLSTVSKPVNKKKKTGKENLRNTNLDIRDINQKPRVKIQRESMSLKTNDIARSCPKKLFGKVEQPFNRFTNNDINGTKPVPAKFVTNRPPSDPLDPQYILPSIPPLEPYEPKFIRDNINVNDIKGTKPRIHIKSMKREQPTNFIADIVDKPKQRYKERNVYVDSLFTEDINKKIKSKSKRVTNPLNPVYQFKFKNQDTIEIGDIDHNKPRILHKESNKDQYNLLTMDIGGAQASTFGNKMFKEKNRRNFIDTNNITDINGAKIGTLKKGLQTKRKINPLDPEYKLSDRFTEGFLIGSEHKIFDEKIERLKEEHRNKPIGKYRSRSTFKTIFARQDDKPPVMKCSKGVNTDALLLDGLITDSSANSQFLKNSKNILAMTTDYKEHNDKLSLYMNQKMERKEKVKPKKSEQEVMKENIKNYQNTKNTAKQYKNMIHRSKILTNAEKMDQLIST